MDAIIADVGAFLAVILVELALSADATAAVGADVATEGQPRVLFWGGVGALAVRIVLGLILIDLLRIPGAMIVAGLALLWICFRIWRDLRARSAVGVGERRFAHGVLGVIAAQVALSFDTTLAVAGIARNSPAIMVMGLVVSALVVSVALSPVAAYVHANRWPGYAGIAVVALTAIIMIWDDVSMFAAGVPAPPLWLGGRSDA